VCVCVSECFCLYVCVCLHLCVCACCLLTHFSLPHLPVLHRLFVLSLSLGEFAQPLQFFPHWCASRAIVCAHERTLNLLELLCGACVWGCECGCG
jgi:hypothetical protein